jgi:hypothetical protein
LVYVLVSVGEEINLEACDSASATATGGHQSDVLYRSSEISCPVDMDVDADVDAGVG